MNLDDIYTGVVSALLLIFIFVMYIAWEKDKITLRKMYRKSHIELMKENKLQDKTYDEHHTLIKKHMKKMNNTNKKKSLFNQMIGSGYTGVLRGGAIGLVTGGVSEAIAAALIYGLTNPTVLFIQKTYLIDEYLPT